MRIVDMHCDTISALLKKERAGCPEGLLQNTGHLDLTRMKNSGYLLQNFALFVNRGACRDPYEEFLALYELYDRLMEENKDTIDRVYTFSDIEENRQAGKMSALLTVEEGGVCKGELSALRELYDKGVRLLTLTWNYQNELCSPAKAGPGAPGLTERGMAFLQEMEALGMIVDVSHMSDSGFYDVVRLAKKPFVASHSNARRICDHVRNMTDEMIHALAEKGGVMGLNFFQDFLLDERVERQDKADSLEALTKHVKHIIQVGGTRVLSLGSDFDGIPLNPDIPGAEAMEKVWDRLNRAGLSQETLDLIFYKNVLRLYRELL